MPDFRIPWFIPDFDEADAEAVKQVVLSGFVNQGPVNREFETELRDYFGVEYALTTPNGTLGLAMSLMALGIGPGDTVLTPDLTFIGTANAIRLTGAEPILVDIDPHDFNLNSAHAKKRRTASTKAVVAVHLNGRPANLDALRELDLPIVEDAAQALDATLFGPQTQLACFSLAPTKTVTAGQGGFILTHDEILYDRLRQLKDHGRLDHGSDDHITTGFNFKVTDLQAALGLSQWKKLPHRMQQVMELDRSYRAELPGLNYPQRPNQLMWPDFTSERRDDIVHHMAENGIQLRPFWPPLHTQKPYASNESFPGADEAHRTACWLPASPNLAANQIADIVHTLKALF